MANPLTLYTFSISHYSEKSRWMLDHSHIPYTEKPLTPFFHIPQNLWRSRGKATTVPILQTPKKVVQDSTHIIHWLDENCPNFALLPHDASLRSAALALEEEFDRFGFHVIRYVYSDTLHDKEAVLKLWSLDANTLQKAGLRLSYPLLKIAFQKLLQTTPRKVEHSASQIEKALDLIALTTQSGKPYLVGNDLSVADITAAALLAPIACPDEHPVYGLPSYRANIAPMLPRFADHPGLAWVRSIYRDHRR